MSTLSKEWEETVNRMGRWIDFRNDYKTLYPWFMESVWWAFSELFKKGLVYKGVKVMPFSTACSTPLSNFEAGQNYKDVVDPAGMGPYYTISIHYYNNVMLNSVMLMVEDIY
uniref:tRNA-synt_1 domain-containing protein n=1 Tax=Heterorhabditis bacteriophora TaxID=37862 RepID=A0A1I7XE89_HETBA